MKLYKEKLKISLIYTLFPILLYGLMGPLEIYVGNIDEFVFTFNNFFWAFLCASLMLWLVGSMVLACFPEKILKVIHVVIFIFSMLSYVQNLYLNRKLMNMNGSAMNWGEMSKATFYNLILWGIACVILAVIPFIWKKYYQKIYLCVTAFISAIQLVTIISLIITSITAPYSTTTISSKDMFKVEPNSNVIVLILDCYYNIQFENTMEDHPEIAETLKDFTYYNNADCHYNFTFPSIPCMLTGTGYDPELTADEWKAACWQDERCESFYDTLHSLGYECDLYSSGYLATSVGPIENLSDIFSNTVNAVPCIDYKLLYAGLMKMSIYKYVPYFIKPQFEVPTYVMNEAAFWDGTDVAHENGIFYKRLLEEGLSVDGSLDNKFAVIHLAGLHRERHTNADGSYSKEIEETGLEETAEGVGVVVREYIEQLKALDEEIYDNTTIIITADHGYDRDTPQPVYFIKPPNTVQDELQVTSAPISHDDFQATVLACIGQDTTGYGTSVFDWSEGDRRMREYWYPADLFAANKPGFYIYRYDGNRNDLINMPDEEAEYIFCR